jgi:hypothetical protein
MSFQAELRELPTANTLVKESRNRLDHFRFYYAEPKISDAGTTLSSVIMSPFHTFDHTEQTFDATGRCIEGLSSTASIGEILYFMQYAKAVLDGSQQMPPEINRMEIAQIILFGHEAIQNKAAYIRQNLDRDEQTASDLALEVMAALDL